MAAMTETFRTVTATLESRLQEGATVYVWHDLQHWPEVREL